MFKKAKMRAYGNWLKRQKAYNEAIDDVLQIVRTTSGKLRRRIRALKIKGVANGLEN